MVDRSIIICGLPASGKTTFLAALWHLILSREVKTMLKFRSLRSGDFSHLNALATRWRDAKVQDRTMVGSTRLVSMNLTDSTDAPVRLTFPDLSGEAYRRMWEERDCAPDVADILASGSGVMLFILADRIVEPHWVVDVVALSNRLGLESPPDQVQRWQPQLAPTQVQLVDILQLLRSAPLDTGPRRLVVMLSAWDKVATEGRSPKEYLAERLPLLDQYLQCGADGWTWRVYGVSAQGGDYEPENEQDLSDELRNEIEALRAMDQPSNRIRIVGDAGESHDLTESIAWLMG